MKRPLRFFKFHPNYKTYFFKFISILFRVSDISFNNWGESFEPGLTWADSTLIFETLDVVDFKVSGSIVEVNSKDDNEIVSDFKLTKKVKAISAETKTKTFTIGTPQKFLTLTLDETNVVDIISVKDLNDNEYETIYLKSNFSFFNLPLFLGEEKQYQRNCKWNK